MFYLLTNYIKVFIFFKFIKTIVLFIYQNLLKTKTMKKIIYLIILLNISFFSLQAQIIGHLTVDKNDFVFTENSQYVDIQVITPPRLKE